MEKKEKKTGSSGLSFQDIWSVLKMTGSWCYKLRSVLLAIPVAIAAIAQALKNIGRLPSPVGINMLESGEFAILISRGVAVMGPLAITALCLMLMFCSKRVLYPWLISVFSLILPWLLWITNTFPA
jgi:hypothetical protein